jgi:hypothetical protein
MSVRKYSDKQLQEEIDRRNAASKATAPQMKTDIDIEPLRKLLIAYVDKLKNDGNDEDFKDYIFETSVEMFYGSAFWHWKSNL